ncbi:alpha-glucosidase [Nocardioides sp. WL0053]|uniref:Alpha-glucosidase n=1 Tax=Nocardioides jiangsuensis TaxID=2866161 RepID=A0ABS7RE47_9ACTN|nr:alpha-glucosidase [Nocardioides jiangsuensis]MBY9073295.1 alpha-glucosidase [Nocardioides jiangsuensis]
MQSQQWWKSAVVYQIYPRSFADSDGDGVGDLRGVINRLDHLERLGVDVVWLSPVYPSPMDDNGYDISDYQDIDPTFGDLDTFDELVAGLHGRGIKVVMDLVVNHTSDEHAWFAESRAGLDSPRRDWYWWRPARPGTTPGTPGAEPNNWGSFFSGSAWQYDERSGEYYLHLFSRKQPDLNWENPEVREAVYTMMRWWLDRGIDGFRMDVINFISKVTELPDGEVRPGELFGDGTPYVFSGPRIHEYLHEMHQRVFAGIDRPLLLVGEMPGVTVEDAALFTDPDRAEVDMVFQFEHVGIDQGDGKWDVLPFDLRTLKASLGRWQRGLAARGWNSLYWNNHDQPRVVSRFGDDKEHRERSAKMLGTVLHLHRGTPYIYQGEELGMSNSVFHDISAFRDIEAVNHYGHATAAGADPEQVLTALRTMGRDNARTPMQWDGTPRAGFTTGTPWIGVNPNHVEVNAAAQYDDKDSVFTHYRRLVDLRHSEPAVAYGDFTMLLEEDPHVYAFTRRLEGTELLVLGNFTGETRPVDLPLDTDWAGAELLVTNVDDPHVTGALAPWETRVLARRLSA